MSDSNLWNIYIQRIKKNTIPSNVDLEEYKDRQENDLFLDCQVKFVWILTEKENFENTPYSLA